MSSLPLPPLCLLFPRNPLRSSGRFEKKSSAAHKSKKPTAAAAGTNFARVAEWVKSLSVDAQKPLSPPAQDPEPPASAPPGQAPVGPHPGAFAWFGSLDRGGAPAGGNVPENGVDSLKRGRSVPPTSASSDLEAEAERMWAARVPPLHPEEKEEEEKGRPNLRQPDGASNPHLHRELAPSLGVTK